ncbi:MAG: hypothetical protein IKZ29_07630 [Clostridiales bacterium]|nr:hypothetical protein [Clostridiales bacterium]
MDRKPNEHFIRDISLEEFDHITDGVEDHVFSDGYLARKESIMKNATSAKITKLGAKVAVAAAAVIIATPFIVNAATGGELFDRLWGNENKKNVESHVETFVEEGKKDKDGNDNVYTITYPKIEYVESDPKDVERLLGDKIVTEPIVCTVGEYTITVEGIVRDERGLVVAYTIERAAGVNCLIYSQLENESKGAFLNDDQNFEFGFKEGSGKIWVDMERSTETKLYCSEYMQDYNHVFGPEFYPPITDHLTLEMTELKMTRNERWKYYDEHNDNRPEGVPESEVVKESKTFTIPVADKLNELELKSSEGGIIKISPIAMEWDARSGSKTSSRSEFTYPAPTIKIVYKDGSEYLVYSEDTNNVGYVFGSDYGLTAYFNRLADTDNIAKITIDDMEFTL